MYLNVISMKNGKTLPFQSEIPYSVDKIVDGWNIITDERNGQIISVRGTEIASIASQDVDKIGNDRKPYRNTKGAQRGANGVKKGIKIE